MKTLTGRLKLESPLPPLSASSEVSAPRDLKLIARCKQIYVTADKLLEKEKRFCHARSSTPGSRVKRVNPAERNYARWLRSKRNFYWLSRSTGCMSMHAVYYYVYSSLFRASESWENSTCNNYRHYHRKTIYSCKLLANYGWINSKLTFNFSTNSHLDILHIFWFQLSKTTYSLELFSSCVRINFESIFNFTIVTSIFCSFFAFNYRKLFTFKLLANYFRINSELMFNYLTNSHTSILRICFALNYQKLFTLLNYFRVMFESILNQYLILQ